MGRCSGRSRGGARRLELEGCYASADRPESVRIHHLNTHSHDLHLPSPPSPTYTYFRYHVLPLDPAAPVAALADSIVRHQVVLLVTLGGDPVFAAKAAAAVAATAGSIRSGACGAGPSEPTRLRVLQ